MTDQTTTELTHDAERFKRDYLNACKTIADMHAAVGRGGLGPIRGVVEDVEDVRVRAERAEAALRRVHDLAGQIEAGTPWADNRDDLARRIRDAATITATPGPEATEATELATTARVFAGLHRSAEETVTRVIGLYERWEKADGPPLGTTMAAFLHWWPDRLAELHDAIQPPIREQRERPTHPDGTPYRYHEIKAEGWGYCDGCHMWSTGTADRPHQCAGTHDHAIRPTTDHTTE